MAPVLRAPAGRTLLSRRRRLCNLLFLDVPLLARLSILLSPIADHIYSGSRRHFG
jgi:hypothetical protein